MMEDVSLGDSLGSTLDIGDAGCCAPGELCLSVDGESFHLTEETARELRKVLDYWLREQKQ